MNTICDASITKAGQVCLPRAVSDKLGTAYGKDRIEFVELSNGMIAIRRKLSLEEKIHKLNQGISEKDIEIINNKTASQMMDEWADSPDGQAYYKEKYGL